MILSEGKLLSFTIYVFVFITVKTSGVLIYICFIALPNAFSFVYRIESLFDKSEGESLISCC